MRRNDDDDARTRCSAEWSTRRLPPRAIRYPPPSQSIILFFICLLCSFLLLSHPAQAVPRSLGQYLTDTFGPGPYSPTTLQPLMELRANVGWVINLSSRQLTDAAALNALNPLTGPFAITGLDLSSNLISGVSLAPASCGWCASEGLTHIFLLHNTLTGSVLGLGTNGSPGLFGLPPAPPAKGLRDTVIYLDLSYNPLGPGGLPPKFGGPEYWFNGASSAAGGAGGAPAPVTDPSFLCRSCGLTALSGLMFPRTFAQIDLSYNSFTNPGSISWGSHFGNASFSITGTLDLSHSGLRALPVGAVHSGVASPQVNGASSSSVIDLSYSNFPQASDWTLSGMVFPGSVILNHCGITSLQHALHFAGTSLGNLDLSNNNLWGNATLKDLSLITDASASIETGTLNIANSNLTFLQLTGMSGLNAARLVLSGNNFPAASSWETQAFAGATISRLELDRAGVTAATLQSNGGNPFEKLNGLQELSLRNDLTSSDEAWTSTHFNRFDPLSNSFLFGADGALGKLTSLKVGDVVSLDSAGFFSRAGQSFLSASSTAVQVSLTLAAGVAPFGTSDPATLPQRLRGPMWNLLTGYEAVSVESRFNYSLELRGSSWVDAAIPPLWDQDAEDARYAEGARLYPVSLVMPLEPAVLHEEFFHHFPAVTDLTYGPPTDSSKDSSSGQNIPWNAALDDASLSSSLLSRAQGLTSFTISVPRDGSPSSPLSSLPAGFFQSLRPDTGFGSLISIDLSAANFSSYPQDLFLGLSRTGTSVALDMNLLYAGEVPIPIGLFDSLSSVSVGSYPLFGTAKLNKARNCPFIGVSAQYYPNTSFSGDCNRCPVGAYSNSVSGFFYCARCTPGSYCLANAIKPCEKGFYQPDSQASTCLACGAGSYSEATGQSQPYSCIPCAIGRYSAVTNATAKAMCEQCPAGSISALPGASVCTQCTAGTYSDSLQVSCTPCPIGMYGEVPGAANRTSGCSDCPGGAVTLVTGATGKGSCVSITCGPGEWYKPDANATTTLRSHFCLNCEAGYSCTDNVRTICPAGSWSPGSVPQCSLCAPGKYSSSAGGTSVASCLDCPSGTFQDAPGHSSCTSCASGSRNPNVGSSDPRDCAPCDPAPILTGTESTDVSSANATLCVGGSASIISLSSLLPAAVAFIETTSASSLSRASYTPVRGGPSLRLTSSPNDATLALAGAYNTTAGSGSAHSSDFDPTADLVNSATMFIVLLVLLIAAIIPLFLYRLFPIHHLHPLDVMSQAHKLAPGGVKVNRPTQWGVAWSLCFICLAIFTAIQLGVTSNAQLLNTLQPAAANTWTGTAQSAIQITLKAYGAPASGSGLPLALDTWCSGDSAMSPSSGGFTNGNLSARALIDGSACVLLVDCLDCGIGGLGSVTLTMPYVTQLLEWEVWVTGAIPGSWSRFYGVVSQLPNSLLDAAATLHFSAIEAYFIDTRAVRSITYCNNPHSRTELSASTGVTCSLPGSTSGSGFELAFSDYETTLAQDRTAVTANSQVALTFEFKKQDVVYQTTITAKLSVFQILSSVLATVVSLLSVFMLLFALSEAFLLRRLNLTSGPLEVDVHIMSKKELAVEQAAARKRAKKLAGLSTPTAAAEASTPQALNSPEGVVSMRKVAIEAMSPTPALAAAAGNRTMGEPHAYGAAFAAASMSQLWAQRSPNAPNDAAAAGAPASVPDSVPGSVPESGDPSPQNGAGTGTGEPAGARGESFLHLNRDMLQLLQRTDGGGGLEGESDSGVLARSAALASAQSSLAGPGSASAGRYSLANVAEEEVLLAPAPAGFAAAAAARANINRQGSQVSPAMPVREVQTKDSVGGASSATAVVASAASPVDSITSPSAPADDDASMLASPSEEVRSVSPGASPNPAPPSTLTLRNRGSAHRLSGGGAGAGGASSSSHASPSLLPVPLPAARATLPPLGGSAAATPAPLPSLISVPRGGGLPPLSVASPPPGVLAPLDRPRKLSGSMPAPIAVGAPPAAAAAAAATVTTGSGASASSSPGVPARLLDRGDTVDVDAEASLSEGAVHASRPALMKEESIDFE